MNNIKRTSDLVKQILTEDETARNNDMFLYLKVCERLNPATLTMPFFVVISSLKAHNLPNFETVRRTRQKIQADFPELASNERVGMLRTKKEAEFREYAKGAVI
jgi:hypothetical protein